MHGHSWTSESSPQERVFNDFVYVSTFRGLWNGAYMRRSRRAIPHFPITVYGASKLAGESVYSGVIVQRICYPTVVLRPFNAYWPALVITKETAEK